MTTFHIDHAHYLNWSQQAKAERMNKYMILAHIILLVLIVISYLIVNF